jgi:hypothetical protein
MAVVRRLAASGVIVCLLAGNVLTLTSTAFNAALSGLLATTLGVRTVSAVLQERLDARDRTLRRQADDLARQRAAARRFGARLAARTKRVASKSLAAIPAEAIPVVGVAVLIAETGYELYAACETLRDLDRLYAELGVAAQTPEDTLESVCRPALPYPAPTP